jgi:hypothetical protein
MIRQFITIILLFYFSACTTNYQAKKITVYTFSYPPFTEENGKGLFIDLIREAYKTQGMQVEFNISTLDAAYRKAKANNAIMLGSREYQFDGAAKSDYTPFYEAMTYLMSIEGKIENNVLGAFSSDEVDFAKRNKMNYQKYSTPPEGLGMLYTGKIGKIICTDISCDQIKITNAGVNFILKEAYLFPVDFVYFDKSTPELKSNLNLLKNGLNEILASGEFVKIQESYRVSNPLFQIPLDLLIDIKISN